MASSQPLLHGDVQGEACGRGGVDVQAEASERGEVISMLDNIPASMKPLVHSYIEPESMQAIRKAAGGEAGGHKLATKVDIFVREGPFCLVLVVQMAWLCLIMGEMPYDLQGALMGIFPLVGLCASIKIIVDLRTEWNKGGKTTDDVDEMFQKSRDSKEKLAQTAVMWISAFGTLHFFGDTQNGFFAGLVQLLDMLMSSKQVAKLKAERRKRQQLAEDMKKARVLESNLKELNEKLQREKNLSEEQADKLRMELEDLRRSNASPAEIARKGEELKDSERAKTLLVEFCDKVAQETGKAEVATEALKAKEEEEQKAKAMSEREARSQAKKQEAERAEADRKAKDELKRALVAFKAKEEADRKAKDELERALAEFKAKEEAERKAKDEAECALAMFKAKHGEAEFKAKDWAERAEAERSSKDELERTLVEFKAKAEAESKAKDMVERALVEFKAKVDAELKAKDEAERALAVFKAKQEEAEHKAREAEFKAKQAEAERKTTDELERELAKCKANEEVERKAKVEAERALVEWKSRMMKNAVAKVRVKCGSLVEQVQFVMRDRTSKTYGGSGGGQQAPDFDLKAGEWLVGMEQRSGASLDCVRFTTNTGRQSQWYGNASSSALGSGFEASQGKMIVALSRPQQGNFPAFNDAIYENVFR